MYEKAEQMYEITRVNIIDWIKYFFRLKKLLRNHKEIYFVIYSQDFKEFERKVLK